jgi:hypothetical protein
MTLHEILQAITENLPKRQKDIITQRFGVGGVKPRTLQALGDKYGITRERVRQIESAGLQLLHKEAEKHEELSAYIRKAVDHLQSLGGVRREDLLVQDLQGVFKDASLRDADLTLLFSIFKKPSYFSESKEFFPFWYLEEKHVKELKNFTAKLAQFLKSKKEHLIEKKKFDELFQQAAKQHNVKEFVGMNFLLLSKKFSVNAYGDFGLSEWREIAPKTVRDKAYLLLKKTRKPLHFREIAQEINKVKFDAKRAHPQTVHNELIKDPKFVLVGRGLYSLREFGIEPGTTREVLVKLLKKKGPMPLEKIVQLVGEQRVLKYNTIFFNLQNKKYFKKNDKGHYKVA